MSRRVIIYLRVSSEDQVKNYSLGTQRPACLTFAQAQDWTIVDTVTEAQTASNDRRPVLQRVLSRIQAGEADTLLVYTQDRLSRDITDTLVIIRDLRRAGAAVWTVLEGHRNTDNALETVMVGLGAFAGQKELEDKRERAMRGQKGRADAGRLLGNARPVYGYRYPQDERYPDGRLQKWRLEENPETAPVVRRIYAEYLAGKSVRSIAARLTLDGIPRPTEDGKAWNQPSSTSCSARRRTSDAPTRSGASRPARTVVATASTARKRSSFPRAPSPGWSRTKSGSGHRKRDGSTKKGAPVPSTTRTRSFVAASFAAVAVAGR